MIRKLKYSGIAFLFFILTATSFAIDIPLAGVDAGGGQKIGYVDMDKIFEIYPETKYAKEDYLKRLDKKKEDLKAKEADLQTIKTRIAVLESTFKELNSQGDGGKPSSEGNPEEQVPQGEPEVLLNLKKELVSKEADLEEVRKRAAEELQAFEAQQSEIILGKIYKTLKELALEEQVTLIVDKSSILYGSAEIDLTERLQNRVRGY